VRSAADSEPDPEVLDRVTPAAAIVLCLLEGASEAEAAHALNCKPGTIKSLLSRAKAKMKEELTNE